MRERLYIVGFRVRVGDSERMSDAFHSALPRLHIQPPPIERATGGLAADAPTLACSAELFCRWMGADGAQRCRHLPGAAAMWIIGHGEVHCEHSDSFLRRLAGNAFNGYTIAAVIFAATTALGRN
ncbi:unnamed protein product [Prorocentrum cordatum]|uniref:Uncharacterized protein n=1 Tax=Prorocentrum cordatum TaxID=2364126 RepID=A0ABN9WVS9_9DINO|nr:unnamed protein product [Polarella glacialis]